MQSTVNISPTARIIWFVVRKPDSQHLLILYKFYQESPLAHTHGNKLIRCAHSTPLYDQVSSLASQFVCQILGSTLPLFMWFAHWLLYGFASPGRHTTVSCNGQQNTRKPAGSAVGPRADRMKVKVWGPKPLCLAITEGHLSRNTWPRPLRLLFTTPDINRIQWDGEFGTVWPPGNGRCRRESYA